MDEELKRCVIVWISKSSQVHRAWEEVILGWQARQFRPLPDFAEEASRNPKPLCDAALDFVTKANEDGVLPPRSGWEGGRGGRCKYWASFSRAKTAEPRRCLQERAPSTAQREVTSQPAQQVLKADSLALAVCTVQVSPSLTLRPCPPSPLQGNFL